MRYKIFDNHRHIKVSSCNDKQSEDIGSLVKIANTPIYKLQENNDLIIVSGKLDDIKDNYIFSYSEYDKSITTGNAMGFIGINEDELNIRSRFDENQGDFFLHYMLMKVCCPNIVSLEHSYSNDSPFDILLFLFPRFLKEALSQGLFKEYRRFEHNDSNVKGTIDISRHIRLNIPFAGRIAYNTREFSYDNHITQLIRHTIEYIKTRPLGRSILENALPEARSVVDNTPSYFQQNRRKVIGENLRQLQHPYFTKYTALQKLCLQILRHEGLKYGDEKDKVHGILFDGAWLWEEYVATIIKEDFDHYTESNSNFRLFTDRTQKIIPDYLSKDKSIVADAKYIQLSKSSDYGEERANAIYYKTIAYMMRWNCKRGLLFYPENNQNQKEISLIIDNGKSGKDQDIVVKIPLIVPQTENEFSDFICKMKSEQNNEGFPNYGEYSFLKKIKSVLG